MDAFTIAGIGTAALFVLIALHVPIGIAMAVSGVVGVWWLLGDFWAGLSLIGTETTAAFSTTELALLPLFLLMGSFAGAAGLSADVYRLADALVGHRRGGLAMATIAGCAGFGAVCGSGIATAATMVKVALPEMEKRGYRQSLGAGSIAAGGTLGILIPPSIMMVLYAALTKQFVIDLFIAAIVPGIIAVALHFAAIAIYVRLWPDAAPPGPRRSWMECVAVARSTWLILTIIAMVSGGLYTGIFTVSEAAGVGVVLTLLGALFRSRLKGQAFWDALADTAANVGMLYMIVIGSHVFGYFITLTNLPEAFVQAIAALDVPPLVIIFAILVMYIILGCIFDEVAAMILTLPFVFPLILSFGYDPVWWGIVNVMVIEIGLIAPPIGLNVFVLHGMRRDIPLQTIFRGIAPFLVADLVRLALITAFPALSLWLLHSL